MMSRSKISIEQNTVGRYLLTGLGEPYTGDTLNEVIGYGYCYVMNVDRDRSTADLWETAKNDAIRRDLVPF